MKDTSSTCLPPSGVAFDIVSKGNSEEDGCVCDPGDTQDSLLM
jgi:hypothetical protein